MSATRRKKSQHNVVKIPKLIMQTWKNDTVPEKWAKSPESIKECMPDWKYVLMTDDANRAFVEKHFPDFLPYYDAFPYGIQRADAIRYCWLYVHGGIYIDLDFEMQHSLESLFYNDAELYLVCSGNIGSVVTNSFMASKPKCRIWLDMIEYMKRDLEWWCKGKHMIVMNSTGPVALNYVIKESSVPYVNLPKTLMMPCSVCNIEHCNTDQAWLKPLPGSSWIAYDTVVYNYCMCNWRYIIVFLTILLIIIIVLFFLWYFDMW